MMRRCALVTGATGFVGARAFGVVVPRDPPVSARDTGGSRERFPDGQGSSRSSPEPSGSHS